MSPHADLHTLSLREMIAGVQARRWTAADVVRDHAQRIAAREREVQAWAHLDLERARRRAESIDASGEGGPLAGVPIAVKDIIDVAGMPTRCGSPIYADVAPATATAACVAALERAGAVVLGKSVTTEFAYYAPGRTRNPWNPRHTPGGSSMGSAAAVACGMAAGALGTQTNGSVIRPAAFCGVVGFKPSYGTVSNHGTLDPWPTLDHTGVFARSVADAALLASIVSDGAIAGAVRSLSRPPRLAVVRSPAWHLAQAPQTDALQRAAHALASAGARVDDAELPGAFDEAHRVHRVIMAYEGAQHFGELQARHRLQLSDPLNALLDEGAAIQPAQHGAALASALALRAQFADFLRAYDAVLTPPAPGEAPATLEETGSPAFCTIWTLLGVPAITLPIARGPSGLPLGLQIVGARGDDDALLAIARWCEAHLPSGRA